MTLYLVDIASYQAGMDLSVVKKAGFSLVNIKTSQGDFYRYSAAVTWADKARSLGMGICTFHWLDNSTSGSAQANIAFQRMKDIGGPTGMAHQCDCEDNATWTILRDYVNAMQDKLGRRIVIYTGDWWWTARGWSAASLTPYLWAAPNAGYLSSYPGDTSIKWRAGYGGWGDYSILQYAVQPIANAGGGNVSKSAIRDPAVWAALTGTSQPQPQPQGGDNTVFFMTVGTNPAVFLSDGVVSRHVRDPQDFSDVMTLVKEGRMLMPKTDIRNVANPNLLGYIVGPRPAGFENDPMLGPINAALQTLVSQSGIELTDEQVDRFAQALVSRADIPLDDKDLPAIVAGVKQALAEVVVTGTT